MGRTADQIAEIAPEGYLTKPVMGEELLSLVEKTLAGSGSSSASPK